MAHQLPPLPYAFDALEPHVDARTMEIHHGKHHAAYVAKLNGALEGHAKLMEKSIESLLGDLSAVPESIRGAVRNNGGGHYNHTLFWKIMKAGGGGEPGGELADAIKSSFGSFADLKQRLGDAAANRFGSGWAWMYVKGGKLELGSTPNQDNPLMEGGTPVLGIDVWEHAYYLKYQNRRPDYVTAWWNTVDWQQVAANFKQAR
jgi:Fe-Mn family superoxide dismutase